MKIKLLVAAAAIVMSGTVMAQSAFDGFNFQLGIGGVQSQVSASNTQDTSLIPNPNINNITTGTSFNGMASIGYSQSFDSLFKGFNLAGNVFYVIGNQSAGNVSNTSNGVYTLDPSLSATQNLSGSYKLKNTWGISVEPGYYVSKNLLGYLKFAYVSSTANASFSCYASDNACLTGPNTYRANSSYSTNKTINGVGYGFGGKYQITQNIYGALDFLYVDYSKISQDISWTGYNVSNSSFKPQQYMGFLSIGYKF